jgi:hypothetical protein
VDYLVSLVGRPVMSLGIDRLIRWIKASVALVLLVAAGAAVFDQLHASDVDSGRELHANAEAVDRATASSNHSAVGAVHVSDRGVTP